MSGLKPGMGERYFSSHKHLYRLWGPPSLLCSGDQGHFLELSSRCVRLTIYLCLVPSSRMNGAIPSTPPYAFMVCPGKLHDFLITAHIIIAFHKSPCCPSEKSVNQCTLFPSHFYCTLICVMEVTRVAYFLVSCANCILLLYESHVLVCFQLKTLLAIN